MTGRKGRVVSTENGSIQYESRSEVDVPLEILNLTEKQRFMDGEKVSVGVTCHMSQFCGSLSWVGDWVGLSSHPLHIVYLTKLFLVQTTQNNCN